MVSVTYYFERYRGLASGVAAAGNGIGYIVVPIFLNVLLRAFDWRLTVVIYSLLVAAVFFVAGLLLRPIEISPPTLEELRNLMSLENITNRYEHDLVRRGNSILANKILKPALSK